MVIDDVIVRKGRRNVELDVRIRNPGNEIANITRAELDVIRRTPYAGAYHKSATYDLLLEGEHNSIAVAHVLRKDEVDRFTIRVGFSKYNTSCGFTATLTLLYNQRETATSEPFSFDSAFD